jgi:hypothetical protein
MQKCAWNQEKIDVEDRYGRVLPYGTTLYTIFLMACGNCATILRKRAAIHSGGHGRWLTSWTTR